MTLAIFLLVAGLIALTLGGDILVRGAIGIARKANVNPLMIGLVIVGFGTSVPELVTSIDAALSGSPAIAWGNIVGSNMANSLLILGCAALLAPIVVGGTSVMRDPWVGFAATVALAALAWFGFGHTLLGLAMIGALLAYVLVCYWQEKRGTAPHYDGEEDLPEGANGNWLRPIVYTLVGLAILVAGGHALVRGAIDLARIGGLSETMIGLTIVAVGTSLPELVTSVIAAWRNHPGVALGNVLGSNIYNLLGIGGATMLVAPGAVPADLAHFDLPLLVGSSLLIVFAMGLLHRIGRWAGAGLVTCYIVYLASVIALS